MISEILLKIFIKNIEILVNWSRSARLIMEKYTTFEISKKYIKTFKKIPIQKKTE